MEPPPTDEMLMLAYRDGDAQAFDALYARHRSRLYRYLLHQCGRREQADEMFQEVWMSVIRSRSGYEVTAKFATWLFRIAHNRLVDGYRSAGRSAGFEARGDGYDADEAYETYEGAEAGAPAPASEQPERRLERAQLAGRLLEAIASLPAPQREAFLLAAEGGLTVDEIGNAAGCGFETAKSRLRYAYAKLRGTLEDLR